MTPGHRRRRWWRGVNALEMCAPPARRNARSPCSSRGLDCGHALPDVSQPSLELVGLPLRDVVPGKQRSFAKPRDVPGDEGRLVLELGEAHGVFAGFVAAHQLEAVPVVVQLVWRCGGPVHHLNLIDRTPGVAWINGWIC